MVCQDISDRSQHPTNRMAGQSRRCRLEPRQSQFVIGASTGPHLDFRVSQRARVVTSTILVTASGHHWRWVAVDKAFKTSPYGMGPSNQGWAAVVRIVDYATPRNKLRLPAAVERKSEPGGGLSQHPTDPDKELVLSMALNRTGHTDCLAWQASASGPGFQIVGISR